MGLGNSRTELLNIMDAFIDAGGVRRVRLAESGLPPLPDACYQPWERLNVLIAGKTEERFVSGGEVVTVEQSDGDCVFHPPYAWYESNCKNWRCKLQIIFQSGFIRFVHNERRGDSERLSHSYYQHHTARALPQPGRWSLDALRYLAMNNGDIETARHFVNALLRSCREELSADVADKTDKAERTFQHVLGFLEDHYREPINRETTARSLGLNPSYLSRLFKERTGETFIHHLWRLRLEHAVELLTSGDWPIADIAAHSGFGDTAHFHRTFKKVFGTTPTEYQRDTTD